ncbi:SAF domain-containing protein [Budvicia diplopodorum]|uniref:SAF domain-containing protein n=1 Tax=Budvicia diplopodorum TaxID=1119056 RepID=UPI001357F699|nr:SAF domain-containing protein [Budvicia diplopodorum]
MNHRIMFFISLIVIVVGVIGIWVFVSGEPAAPATTAVNTQDSTKRRLTVAVAKTDLTHGHIIRSEDYQLSEISVEENSDLASLDISALNTGSLRGYRLKSSIKAESYIVANMLESFDSPDYVLNSLHNDEMTYSFPIKATNSYLLNSLAVGDEVALYLRMLEVSNDSRMKAQIGLESGGGSPNKSDKYVLSRLISPLTVLRMPKVDLSGGLLSKDDDVLGYIQLKAKTKDLEFIHTVEKVGELLLLPAKGGSEDGKIRLDTLLPQLRTIKEIRGSHRAQG